MSLRVLITNFTLSGRSGSELYVWDLATALLARGHHPIVFSPVLGPLARDLREATVPVVSSLADVSVAPDVIHGHHNLEIMRAVLHFPGVPAVRVCHGWSDERVQPFPRILRYVAVDDTVRDRMVGEWGVPAARMQVSAQLRQSGQVSAARSAARDARTRAGLQQRRRAARPGRAGRLRGQGHLGGRRRGER